ncbi:hypothetical protein DL766_009711 [Monosporascus sp. MC13-8B]|uniref:adenine phosphoribosyltransferase n=1 Tax=Monosporascus cannonballus TaxID=155416 RepID=A0ABY0H9P1_9PEZI|nr:hypothetical protein DL763_010394 [Monosporascus cannonballus]RYO87614.1 hypothetical protein DL762_004158 [Monosporascus cannonballus]RYP14322.1 hypothetical protein DL766_009711 [Monosporascus sp. MC13-8B]
MSAPATSDSVVEPVANNATPQSGAAPSTLTPDASRREPTPSAAGAAQLTSQSLTKNTKDMEQTKQLVINALQYHQDWPTPGINFIDILPIFRSPVLFASLLDVLLHQIEETFPSNKPEVIVGLEARGFLFGPTLALRLGVPFVPMRKSGKMPGTCFTEVYEKEYGKDEFQIQADSIQRGQKVLIVDDILATGGTAAAARKLVEKCGGDFIGYLFIIEITVLRGHAQRKQLGDKPLLALVED